MGYPDVCRHGYYCCGRVVQEGQGFGHDAHSHRRSGARLGLYAHCCLGRTFKYRERLNTSMVYPQAEHVYTRKQVLDRIRALVAKEVERLEYEISLEAERQERGSGYGSLLVHLDVQLSAYLNMLRSIDALLSEGQ